MAEAGHLVTARNINSISSSFNRSAPKSATQTFKIKASSKRNDISLVNTFSFSSFRFLQTSIFKHSSLFYLSKQFYLSTVPYLMMERKTWLGLSNFWLLLLFCYTINVSRKYSSSYSSFPSQDFFVLMKRRSNKTSRRLITISTSGSRWQGKWTCDYLLSLQDLNLEDLVEDEHKNAHVFINLCIEKVISILFPPQKSILCITFNEHNFDPTPTFNNGSISINISERTIVGEPERDRETFFRERDFCLETWVYWREKKDCCIIRNVVKRIFSLFIFCLGACLLKSPFLSSKRIDIEQSFLKLFKEFKHIYTKWSIRLLEY